MSDLSTFIASLLAEPPSVPHSIQLELDVDGDIPALFEVLLTIMTESIKSWYAPPIQLASLSAMDHAKLVAYFASFGYAFNLEITDIPRVFTPRNREYITQSRLSDMKFQMTNEGKLYTATFDFCVLVKGRHGIMNRADCDHGACDADFKGIRFESDAGGGGDGYRRHYQKEGKPQIH
jgi:hypothetical protein